MEMELKLEKMRKFPIPDKWKKIIVDRWKKDAILVKEPEDIYYIQAEKWFWFNKPETELFRMICKVLSLMRTYPSTTVTQLLVHYMGREFGVLVMEKKKENKLRRSISRALQVLVDSDLVEKIHIEPQEEGKFSVAVYNAPFADEPQKQKTINDYLAHGGGIKKKSTKKMVKKSKNDYEDSADREIGYREMVKKKRFQQKVVKMKKMGFHFYECPNCTSIIKISKNDEHLYTIEGNRLNDPCNCGHEYRERVTA